MRTVVSVYFTLLHFTSRQALSVSVALASLRQSLSLSGTSNHSYRFSAVAYYAGRIFRKAYVSLRIVLLSVRPSVRLCVPSYFLTIVRSGDCDTAYTRSDRPGAVCGQRFCCEPRHECRPDTDLLLRPAACERSIVISMFVCLSLREPISGTSLSISRLTMTVAGSVSGSVAIRYVLPVLWMTSYLHIVNQTEAYRYRCSE